MAQRNADQCRTIVRRAEEDDAPQLISILSEAFSEDPVFDWFLRRGDDRAALRHRVFRSQARYFIPKGRCAITETGDGATPDNSIDTKPRMPSTDL